MQQFQVAAGIDFDSIAPFVFVILIVVSQILGALKKKNAKDGDEEPDVDALERAREIREEIRRKIEERRQEMESGGNRPRIPGYDPTRPDGQPRLPQASPSPKPTIQLNRPVERKTSRAEPVYTPPVSSGPSLEEQLAEQRKKLELAKQKQQDARAKARKMLEKTGVEMRAQDEKAWQVREYSGSVRKQLIGDLRSPNGLRTAVLLREVLGKPIGLRKG